MRMVCALAASTVLWLVPDLATAQVRLGVGAPITGPNAALGIQARNGVAQAVEDINKRGGILGQAVTLAIGDDGGDPKQGVSIANKFVTDGVKMVVGHVNSGVTDPASDVYAEAGIPMISPAATNPKITEKGLWNVARTCSRDDQQGEVAASFLKSRFAGKRIAIVHDKTTYGRGLAEETRRSLNKVGEKEVSFEGINPGEKDYTALVSKLKSLGADVLYYGGVFTEAGLLVRQMRDQGVTAPMMSGDGIVTNEFWSIAGPGAEGTLMTFLPDPRKYESARMVVEAFRAKKIDPEAFTLYAYAATQVLAQAAERAGTLDGRKVAAAVRSGQAFQTVLGDLSFDAKGDVTRPDYRIYVWRNGTYVEL